MMLFSAAGLFENRATIVGKTGKTDVLPRFYEKERSGGSGCGSLVCLKFRLASLKNICLGTATRAIKTI